MPPQPANLGTGNGVLGVLPASSAIRLRRLRRRWPMPIRPRVRSRRPFSRTAPSSRSPPTPDGSSRSAPWKAKAKREQRIEAARNQAHGLLSKADPFTEPVVAKGDKKLFRARFAGLDRDQAEAVCRALKRSDISCITVRN